MKNPFAPSHFQVKLHSKFNSSTTTYKTVNNHAITVDVLIPKNLTSLSPRPVMIRFHGGGWITGSSRYLAWWAPWTLELALREQAIFVTPNYRLLPEANGTDILEDINDFWVWMKTSLPGYLAGLEGGSKVQADLERVLVTGDSAGGHLAVISGLSDVKERGIRGVIAQFPVLDFDDPGFKGEVTGEQPPYDDELTEELLKQLDEHVAAIVPGTVVSEGMVPQRLHLMRGAAQGHRIHKFMGGDPRMRAFDLVKEMESTDSLSRLWIPHGKADVVVKFEGSVKFAELVNGRGEVKVKLHLEEGGGHGFDTNEKVTLETPWIENGLPWILEDWLK